MNAHKSNSDNQNESSGIAKSIRGTPILGSQNLIGNSQKPSPMLKTADEL